MNTKISIKNLHKSFGDKKVLCGIDLEIKESRSLVIIGGSGSGKSVLLKNIIGLIQPDSGNVEIDNVDILKLSQKDYYNIMKKFGFLFQGGALFDSLTVWQNVAFELINSGISKNDAKEIAINKLKAVGLSDHVADLFPAELSGGMQKRVALARAIVLEAKIIFFDEPTTGLDPIMANVINDLIIRCKEEFGATTITVTHDMNSLERIADDIAMIHNGKIIWQGAKDNLKTCGNQYVTQFINASSEGPIKIDV